MHKFLVELASSTATPGGGSVAALAGALAAGLIAMVAGLTLNKKNTSVAGNVMPVNSTHSANNPVNLYDSHPLLGIPEEAKEIMNRCEELVALDSRAYEKVMEAYKLPKETETEKETRKQAIQDALGLASKIPLETANRAFRLLELTELLRQHGLKSAQSDIQVAAYMARSALQGAVLNVEANTFSITDKEKSRLLEEKAKKLELEGGKVFNKIVSL